MDSRERRIDELSRRLDECGGRRVAGAIEALSMSYRSFNVNAEQLLKAVHQFEWSFPNPLMDPSRRRELFLYCYEIVRLFQNTIAAGQSYIEHSLTSVRRRYRRQSFLDEFESAHQARLTDVPVCQFVKELRHFQLHSESISPSVSHGVFDFWEKPRPACQILLDTTALKEECERWRRRSPSAAAYLHQLGGSIDIADLIDEYRVPLADFKSWHRGREREINATALAQYAAIKAELAALSPRIGSWLVDLDAADERTS